MLKHDISLSQYFYLFCKLHKHENELQAYSMRFGDLIGGKYYPIGTILFEDLLDKGLLVKDNADNIDISDLFREQFGIKQVMGDEFYDAYPATATIKGITIPLTSGIRREIYQKYYDAIGGSLDEHREVLKDIAYGKQINFIIVKLENFVNAEMWREIRKIRLAAEEHAPSTTITFDNDIIT